MEVCSLLLILFNFIKFSSSGSTSGGCFSILESVSRNYGISVAKTENDIQKCLFHCLSQPYCSAINFTPSQCELGIGNLPVKCNSFIKKSNTKHLMRDSDMVSKLGTSFKSIQSKKSHAYISVVKCKSAFILINYLICCRKLSATSHPWLVSTTMFNLYNTLNAGFWCSIWKLHVDGTKEAIWWVTCLYFPNKMILCRSLIQKSRSWPDHSNADWQ